MYKQQDAILKNFGISPFELNKIPFYRFYYMVKNLEELRKEEEERNENQKTNYTLPKMTNPVNLASKFNLPKLKH